MTDSNTEYEDDLRLLRSYAQPTWAQTLKTTTAFLAVAIWILALVYTAVHAPKFDEARVKANIELQQRQ